MFAILDILCNRDFGTYRELRVLPHLDHADAEKEEWLWKEYLPDLATVMVDASLNDRSLEENIRLTKKMVDSYGKKIVIEGALQRPAVEGHHAAGELAGADTDADYAAQAKSYVQKTGVDLVVLELGAKQQALGWSEYNSARARAVTGALGKSMIVLHGGSSIPLGQQATLGDDGILRFNIWTRMAREAAEAAAEAIVAQIADIRAGDRVQKYRLRYTEAHFDQQVKSLKEVLQATGYGRFAGN
jgi:fructose/tagatose bisphosphate aldolase